jgi:hypothetical protein
MIDDMAALLAVEDFREHLEDAPGHVHAERYWHASHQTPAPNRKVDA